MASPEYATPRQNMSRCRTAVYPEHGIHGDVQEAQAAQLAQARGHHGQAVLRQVERHQIRQLVQLRNPRLTWR